MNLHWMVMFWMIAAASSKEQEDQMRILELFMNSK